MKNLPGNVNDYGKESYYLEVIKLEDIKLPKLSSDIDLHSSSIPITGDSINNLLMDAKKKEIRYLVIKDNDIILSEIYHHENKYPFLKKIFDSDNNSLMFKVKIFEIDYSKIKF